MPYSVSKPVTAICALVLADRGLVDPGCAISHLLAGDGGRHDGTAGAEPSVRSCAAGQDQPLTQTRHQVATGVGPTLQAGSGQHHAASGAEERLGCKAEASLRMADVALWLTLGPSTARLDINAAASGRSSSTVTAPRVGSQHDSTTAALTGFQRYSAESEPLDVARGRPLRHSQLARQLR